MLFLDDIVPEYYSRELSSFGVTNLGVVVGLALR